MIARADAIAVEGFDAAIERSHAYLDAGADVIFVEAPESVERIKAIAAAIPQPKPINMFAGGNTQLVPLERLRELGYRLIIIPSDLQRAVIASCQRTLEAITQHGDSSAVTGELATFAEREQIVRTTDYLTP